MNHAGGICRWRWADEGELQFCSHTTTNTKALENKVCQTTEALFMRRAHARATLVGSAVMSTFSTLTSPFNSPVNSFAHTGEHKQIGYLLSLFSNIRAFNKFRIIDFQTTVFFFFPLNSYLLPYL